MLEVIVFAALLVAVVGFMIWDRRKSARPGDTVAITGFSPGESLAWQIPLLASGVSGVVAVAEAWALLLGSAPLWTSSRPVWQALHSLLGAYTNVVPSAAITVLLVVIGIRRRRSHMRSRALAARSAA